MMLSDDRIRAVWVLCLGGFFSSIAGAQTIVWTDTDGRKIQSKVVTGGSVSTIVQFPAGLFAENLHYEPRSRKLYYLYWFGSGSIFQRSNVDGSSPENIPTSSAWRFALNSESRKLHWITPPPGSGTALNRSELDGTGAESHSYATCCIFTLYAIGNDIFFGAGNAMQKGIWRAAADGSNEQFLQSTGVTVDLAFDPVEEKLYVATSEHIDRMNLDGTGFQIVVHLPAWQQLISGPNDVEVDYRARKLYWTDRVGKVIQRSNLDGSNVEDFVTANETGNPDLNLRGLTIIQPPAIPSISGLGLLVLCALIIVAGSLVAAG